MFQVSDNLKKVLIFFAFFVIVGGVFLFSQWPVDSRATENPQVTFSEPVNTGGDEIVEINVVELQSNTKPEPVEKKVERVAKSAISFEFNISGQEKVLFEKNKLEKLPIASLTKLMTALIVLKNYDLGQKVIISKDAMAQVGEQGNLKEGEEISVANLLHLTLIESSNRASFALSEVIGNEKFVELMNQEAVRLGLDNTHFQDNTGLSDNSYSTAEDLVKLTKYLFLNYPLFKEIVSLKEYNLYLSDGTLHHKLINTNELLGQSGVIGGKTGYTLSAGGCFMVIQKRSDANFAINIVLGAGDRLLEMQKLIALTADL